MYIKIRQHVDDLFKSVEANASVIELKEEIIANSTEKYDDLIAAGMDEEAAYAKVISGIGNVSELLGNEAVSSIEVDASRKKSAIFISSGVGLYILGIIPPIISDGLISYGAENIFNALMFAIWAAATFMVVFGASIRLKGEKEKTNDEKKAALIRSTAIGMYVFALVPVMLLDNYANDILGPVLMFLIAGIATIMIVYQAISRPKSNHEPETVVEEFKQWKEAKDKNPICKTVQSIVWGLAVVIYILISFTFSAWPISWIIFIIAGIVSKIIKLCFDLTK